MTSGAQRSPRKLTSLYLRFRVSGGSP